MRLDGRLLVHREGRNGCEGSLTRAKERDETQEAYILSCLETHEKSAEYDLQSAEIEKVRAIEYQKQRLNQTAVLCENAIDRCRERLSVIAKRLQMFRNQS